jgi:hypothetical protein
MYYLLPLDVIVNMAADIGPNDITVTITPYLPLVGTVAAGLLVGAFAIYNRRKGNIETRAPDVNEIWMQQAREAAALDFERRARRRLENYVDDLLRAFRGYVRRVQRGGSTDLTTTEQKFHDEHPPTTEISTAPPA